MTSIFRQRTVTSVVLTKKMGNNEKAKVFLENVLKNENKVLGHDHVNIATTYKNLGPVHTDVKKYGKAEAHFSASIRNLHKTLGTEHFYILCTYNSLGIVYQKKKDFKRVKYLHERAF